jgi:hypothetical protein
MIFWRIPFCPCMILGQATGSAIISLCYFKYISHVIMRALETVIRGFFAPDMRIRSKFVAALPKFSRQI